MMKIAKKLFIVLLGSLTIVVNSCSNSEDHSQYTPPTLVSFEETGLLGKPISIKIENFEVDKVQIFFDLEKAYIQSFSEDEIIVIVPPTLKRSNPTLKIIDLNENKTILEKTFLLKKPIISKYNSDAITFNETLTIYGENFDSNKDLVSVLVNDEKAIVLNSDYNKIEVQIPSQIISSDLKIKVKSQLQETTSSVSLVLKKPIIKNIQQSEIWLQQYLYIDVENFNPDSKYGEILINDIPAYFNFSNGKVEITVPPGPYKNFAINNITYKTAGLTTSYETNLKIANDFILVDHIDDSNIEHEIFTHNNKAYVLSSVVINSNDVFTRSYSLLEFSPVTEKWTKLTSFKYSGNIVDAVFDNDDTLYLYKMSVANQSFTMSKLDLNTFRESEIDLPSNKIFGPTLFAYRDNLYMINGLNNVDGKVSVRDQKYKYSKTTGTWTTLPGSSFSTLPLTSKEGSGKCKYLFNGDNIYISYGLNYKTYKINPNLNVTEYPYRLYLEYGNTIIGQNVNYNQLLFNIETNQYKTLDVYGLFGYTSNFFTLNNQIYYLKNSWSVYYQNTTYTQKLKKDFFNGIL
ncbi:IPT/TIG domain-containing protein [Flavobacterium notoginsengisoli]|uniref:IPT/TIG domain-containing protein n=1 Tax=Flavobacterium notoginsengisoli TaxID=1478199 RepID=UPI00363695BB